MKKLALVLGTLLLAANASAKEVVAAPVAIDEPIVQEVEVPAEKPAFKPSGFVSMEQKYFGTGEHDDVTQNYFRTEFQGSIQMTETDNLEWRVRSYDDLNSENSEKASQSENTETRYRWLHDFGAIKDSKISFATRFEMEENDDYDHFELQTRFNFQEYVKDYSWLDTTDFTLAPKIRYVEYGETDDSATGVGMDFSHYAILPWGFEWDLTVYYLYSENSANGYINSSRYPDSEQFARGTEGKYTSSGNNIDVEAYLYWNHGIWESQDGFYGLNAYAEGGLDSLTYRDGDGDTNNNSMYVMPELQLSMNLNPSTALTLGAGAEYRNWNEDEMGEIKDFTWQPFTRIMIMTSF